MRQVIVVACLHLGLFLAQPALGQCVVPSYNQAYGVLPNYTASQAFVARVNYPSTPTEKLPSFMNKDFRADWKAYMNDVLDYALDGNGESGLVEFQNPDYAAYAKACGASGYQVETLEDFEAAYVEALAGNRPAVIDAKITRWALPNYSSSPEGRLAGIFETIEKRFLPSH
jgi:hypothetical protein